MHSKSLIISHLKEINSVAKAFLELFPNDKVFAFFGTMGSGKTTFIKAICKELGVIGNSNSPTFALVNEYPTKSNQIIYHFDFYRINNISEVYDLGYEEYFYSGNYCFIEWPEKIEELLPENFVKVNITVNDDNSRTLTIEI
ncbi:MAG: tRNA (adenosine(37)-N6)-threonylcarbamoyltransferase complex ATPase subunit type 1 TsaE [Bacteroidetes bacterium GWA2_30_7]|nr:MAG: tRNA (adenosine(37)-N6)-threonylcarbamoyltransferase complex ATPase subunit type 1 TsaE [Bacteroidetes bacterium GWA2_30_7]